MCRNITPLRGLEPPATTEEIEAAARQYVRKVSGLTGTSAATTQQMETAISAIAAATTVLLASLPARRNPPTIVPPLRRLGQPNPRFANGRPSRQRGSSTPDA